MRCLFVAATFSLCLPVLPALADETDVGAHLDIELNAVEQVEAGCQLTFVALNGYAAQIDQAVFETVLFDAKGQVERLTLFDFGRMPPARPRVRQFVVPALQCASLSRLLINGVHACSAPDLEGEPCATGLTVSSRIDVELMG